MAEPLTTPESVSIADGVVTSFATNWTFEYAAEVRVTVDGQAKAEGVHYDLSAGAWLASGANVVFRAGHVPVAGARVVRSRVTLAQQLEPFGDQEAFRPLLSERAYDRLTRKAQDQQVETARALQVPPGETATDLPLAPDRRGRVLGFADTADAPAVAVPNDSVAVASDLLQAAIARAGAEAAQAGAEAQVVEAEAVVAQGGEFANQAGIQRAGAEAARDAAELAVTAIPVGTIYNTAADGIAAVADGAKFWCVAVGVNNALELRQRAGAGSTLLKVTPSIASANRGNVVPVVQENVSGNNWMLAPAPGSAFNGDGTDSIYVFRVTPANTGLGIFVQVAGFNSGDPRALRWPDGAQVVDGDLALGTTAELRFKTAGANTGSWTLLSPARPPQIVKSNFVKVEQTNASDYAWQLTPTPGNTFIGDGSAAVYAFTVEVDHTSGLGITAEIAGFNTADPRMVVYPDGGQIVPGQLTVGTGVQLIFNGSGPLIGKWTMLTPARPRSADTTTLTSFYARGAAARAVQQGFEA